MILRRCNLCNKTEFCDCVKFNKFIGADPENKLYKCESCGLIQRFSLPNCSPSADRKLYWGEYSSGTSEINEKMRARLLLFSRLINSGNKSLLDIGCGSGTFVKTALESGWDAWGTELDKEKIDSNRILNINISDSTSSLIKKESFHIVHMSHVLEHVDSPVRFIKEAASYLKPDGYLFIEVPNELFSLTSKCRILLNKQYKSATAYYQHRSFFSKETLGKIVSDHTDLSIIYIKTPFSYYGQPLLKRIFDLIQSFLGFGAIIELLAQKHHIIGKADKMF